MRASSPRALALVLGALLACRPAGGSLARVTAVDDAGDTVRLAAPAGRIVSLNPTTTEILFAIGAGSRVVGRTSSCDYPPAAAAVPSVGDGFPPNVEAVAGLRPDLVVIYHSATNAPAAGRLSELGIAVARIRTDLLADVTRAARLLGDLTGTRPAADSLVHDFERGLARATAPDATPRPSALLLAWDQPIVVLGAGSFASELLQLAGARNVFADVSSPSASVALEAVAARDPSAVVTVGDAPAGFAARPEWRVVRAVRDNRILQLTQSYFTRPSLRAPDAIRELRARLAPFR
ncbi:MAG: ABC transporter substrate-binding protein [Gemmatimonadales bacterium]